MAKRLETTKATPAVDPTTGSMEQIRELLFGSFQRAQDSRLAKMEAVIDRTAATAADQLATSRSELERDLAARFDQLNARLDKLGRSLESAEKTAAESLAATAEELSERLSGLDKHFDGELKSQGKRLEAGITSLRDDFDRAVERLDDQKTDRADLGDFLIEIGMRLKGDATLDAIEATLNGEGEKVDGAADGT